MYQTEHVPSSPTTETPLLSLAHLSDPHLPPPPVLFRQALNKRALSLLSWKHHRQHVHLAEISTAIVQNIRQTGVNTILVSGDLTNFGTPSECTFAARWLASLPFPALVIPGNHDCMVHQKREKGIGQWEEWSARTFPYVCTQNGVAIIGVNSGVPTPPFMAYGRVGTRQLTRLEKQLERLKRAGLCRIVMIHHPPAKGLVPWRKSLLDHRAFTKVLQRTGAELVLHGHSHDATLTHIAGTDIPLLGVASASLMDEREHRQACWNHLTIHPHPKGWTITLARHRPDGTITERACWLRSQQA